MVCPLLTQTGHAAIWLANDSHELSTLKLIRYQNKSVC
jgi:hypothetical protein